MHRSNDNGNVALEVTIFVVILAVTIVAVLPSVVPSYNSGAGVPVGGTSLGWASAWNISSLSSTMGSLNASSSIIDYAKAMLNFLIISIIGLVSILVVILYAYPTLVFVLHIPPTFALVLQAGIYFCYFILILQVLRGGSTWDNMR